ISNITCFCTKNGEARECTICCPSSRARTSTIVSHQPLSSMVASNITLTLVGAPTALIEIGSLRLLTDPTFDPPRFYQKGPVRYQKISGPALSMEEIGVVDAVLLSHDQPFDNLDDAGRAVIPTAGTTHRN